MPNRELTSTMHAPLAGILTWWIPGLGHMYLGDHKRGLVLMVTITATFWSGMALGGVRDTVDPHKHKLWFMAQLCSGGNTLFAYMLHHRADLAVVRSAAPDQPRHWLASDVGVHYTGIAGLLNLLVILDALVRSEESSGVRRALRAAQSAGP